MNATEMRDQDAPDPRNLNGQSTSTFDVRRRTLAGRRDGSRGKVSLADGLSALAAVAISLVAGFGVARLDGLPYGTLVAILLTMFLLVLLYEWRKYGDPVTPMGIAAGTGILLFVLRPITIQRTQITSPGASADDRYFTTGLEAAGVRALAMVAIFYATLFIAHYFFLNYRETWQAARRNASSIRTSSVFPDQGTEAAARVVKISRSALVAASAFTLILNIYLITSLGGLATYFEGLAFRASFLQGRVYLTFTYLPLLVFLVVHVLVRRRYSIGRVWDGPAIFGAVMLLVATLTTGARGPLILGFLLPMLILKQTGWRPFRSRTVLLLLFAMASAAVSFNILVRDRVYLGDSVGRDFASNPIDMILTRLTNGSETKPFDSLIRLNEVAVENGFAHIWGSSYLNMPAWFIPRSVWADKPFGGANTWFTTTYVPRFYGAERIETSLSAIGEAFANFGYVGIVVMAAFLGVLFTAFSRSRWDSGNIRQAAAIVVGGPMVFSVLRGDSFQSGSTFIMAMVFLLLYTRWLSRSGSHGSTNRLNPV